MGMQFYRQLLFICWTFLLSEANPDAKRLYDDLIMKGYNKYCRPVSQPTQFTLVRLGLSLAQIVDVDEVNQILTVNLWVEQEWEDSRFVWDTKQYNNITMLHVPTERIWRPDIVLYNNADGAYTVTTEGKAVIYPEGKVVWKPPMQFKSSCEIDVEYFPFDRQTCHMKFGPWTNDYTKVDMYHITVDLSESERPKRRNATEFIQDAMDLSDYQTSVEWDLMETTCQENMVYYPCCPTKPYADTTFNITIKRKTLYYVINLVSPCISITILTCLSFYLPSYSGEKISITISVFLSLSIFQLVLIELVPASSLNLSLIGRFILVTSILVTLSVLVNTFILCLNYRSSATHEMSQLTRWLFIRVLSKVMYMGNPSFEEETTLDDSMFTSSTGLSDLSNYANPYHRKKDMLRPLSRSTDSLQASFYNLDESNIAISRVCEACVRRRMGKYPPNMQKGMDGMCFLVRHYKDEDKAARIKDEWQYVALVFDRLLLWLYIISSIVISLVIYLNAPALYDDRIPLVAPKAKSLKFVNFTGSSS